MTMRRRPAPKLKNAAAVRDRLFRMVSDLYGGDRQLMERKCGLDPNTARKWFYPKPVVPGPALLAQVAERAGVSLDWLVLGRGPMKRSLIAPVQLMGDVRGRLARRAEDQGQQLRTIRALMMLNKDENEPWDDELGNEELTELWNDELEDLWDALVDHGADHFERVAAWESDDAEETFARKP
jgi:hypothetical protein